MKKYIYISLLFSFIALSNPIYAQPGFIGKLNSVTFEYGIGTQVNQVTGLFGSPSVNEISVSDDSLSVTFGKKALIPAFKITYNRVLSKKFEAFIGFQSSTFSTYVFDRTIQYYSDFGYNTLELTSVSTLKLNKTAFDAGVKYFFTGIAPVGSYVSLDVSYANVSAGNDSSEIYFSDNIYYYEVNSTENLQRKPIADVVESKPLKTIAFRLEYGMVFPLNRYVALYFNSYLNFLRFYTYDGTTVTGSAIKTRNYFSMSEDELDDYKENIKFKSDKSMFYQMAYAGKLSSAVGASLGIKVFF